MVFEKLVTYFLEKYLGDYIESLDTKKLKIDLWNGECYEQFISFNVIDKF
jgi:hypothetical protein